MPVQSARQGQKLRGSTGDLVMPPWFDFSEIFAGRTARPL
jgi:hypothetical protein